MTIAPKHSSLKARPARVAGPPSGEGGEPE